jgi:hypothetical protein
MRRYWIAAFSTLAIVLAVMTGAEAANFADDICPAAPGPVNIDDSAKAATVANGYFCLNADPLNITFDLPSAAMDATLEITAASITVTGTPANRVDIINNNLGSNVFMTAKGGGIKLDFATIKAHNNLFLVCTSVACPMTSTNSDIIAATSFTTPVDGGNLGIYTVGPVNIQSTNIHGGDTMHIESSTSSVTLLCGGQVSLCTSPLTQPPPPIVAKCFDEAGNFIPNCTVTFPTAGDLNSVCFRGQPGADCNGGHKEKGIFAFTFIDIHGSKITSASHMTFTAKTEDIRMAGADIQSDDSLYFFAGTTIDMKGAKVNNASHLTFWAQNCGAPPFCIDAEGAQVHSDGTQTFLAGPYTGVINLCKGTFEEDGGGTYNQAPPFNALTGVFPTMNAFGAPPYDASVKFSPPPGVSACATAADAAKFKF